MFDRWMQRLLAVLLASLILCVTWQVVSRYAIGNPSQWTEELARFLLIWISLLGGAYAYQQRAHLGLDLLAPKLSTKQQRWHRLSMSVLVLIFALAVLTFGGGMLVYTTWTLEQYSAALNVPMALVYCALPWSGLMLLAYSGKNIRDDWFGQEN